MSSSKFMYKCTDCGKEYDSTDTIYLCPVCCVTKYISNPSRGVLKTLYDYHKIKKRITGFNDLKTGISLTCCQLKWQKVCQSSGSEKPLYIA